MSLYEISTVYRQFMDLVELEEIPEEAIADTLEGILFIVFYIESRNLF